MKRALALAALLPLGACESQLNHMFNYDDVHRNSAQEASAPAAEAPSPAPAAPAPAPEARQENSATAPPAQFVAAPPAAIVTPPGAIAPPMTAAPPASEPPGTAFCRSAALGDSNAGAFDEATRRTVYVRSLAQCMALHGDGASAR